jgi:hypothetical protein
MLDSEPFGEAAVGLSVYTVISIGAVAERSAGNADTSRSSLVLRMCAAIQCNRPLRVMGSSCSVVSRFVSNKHALAYSFEGGSRIP